MLNQFRYWLSLYKLQKINTVILDSVGVVFSETVSCTKDSGESYRFRSHHDGQGISYLRLAGYKVAVITSETNSFTQALVDKFNNTPAVISGAAQPLHIIQTQNHGNKLEAVLHWLKIQNVTLAECCYMGDECVDVPIMQQVGYAVAPQQAVPQSKKSAHYISRRRGGDGAVRELCDILLAAKNINVKNLSTK